MGSSPPAPPPPPNPIAVAGAQTGQNVSTAIANTALANANTYGPYGQTNYNISHFMPVTDPNTGAIYNIPVYNQTTRLSPAEQQIFNTGQQTQFNLAQIGANESAAIGNLLSTPQSAPSGNLTTSVHAGPIQNTLAINNQDINTQVQNAQNAIFSRLNPQMALQQKQLDTQLQSQGYVPGTDAYNTAMDQFGRQYNDYLLQSDLTAQQEQQALFGQSLQSGQFYNAAQAQSFNEGLQNATLNNSAYQQQLQTDAFLRNEPINEISALLSGSQVQIPGSTPYQPGTIAPTPIGDYYYQNYAGENQNYASQLNYDAQSNAGLYGAIGKIGGAALGMFGGSDRAIKRDIKRVGERDGLPLYEFRYLDSEQLYRGHMAQDIEKLYPNAITQMRGIKMVSGRFMPEPING